MRRPWLTALSVCLMVGCGEKSPLSTPPPPPATPTGSPLQPDEPLRPTGQSGGLIVRLFPSDDESGGPILPTLEVSSPNCREEAQQGVYVFEDATVVIYGKDRSETRIHAKRGMLDQNANTAHLTDGVTVEIGAMILKMTSLSWNNDTREAVSDDALTLEDGETRLAATGMRFSPDTDTLLLRGVSGSVGLKE